MSAKSQTAALNGVCENGGRHATVSGLNATNFQLGVIPSCTVTVYFTGTTTIAPIFADSLGTPLANPFTGAVVGSTAPGQWLFYAATGVGYDVVMSGGIAPNTFPTPVTLTGLKVGGGGGGGSGTVTAFSAGNLPPLFTTSVATPTTTPALSFNLTNAGNLSFFGNVGGSTGPPQFVTFVPGANIVFTPIGGTTLQISSAGGGTSSCGPLIGDATSTNCGTGNLTSPSAAPAFLQAFGDNNLNTPGTNTTQVVTVGDANANNIPTASPHAADLIGVGNDNLDTLAGQISDAVCMGDQNCRNMGWNSDVVAIGQANFLHNVGPDSSDSLTEAVAIGLANVQYIQSGGSVVGIGQSSVGGIVPTGSTDVFEVVGIGDSAGFNIGNTVNDLVLLGDQPAATIPTNSNDIVAIGDAADKQCLTFTGCGAVPNPVAVHDVIAIGHDPATFNQAIDIVAIGDFALGSSTSGAGLGFYNQGIENIAIGHRTLTVNTTGTQNVALGGFAGADGFVNTSTIGNSNKTGSNNTWIGYDSGPNTTTQLSNTAALGYQAHNTVSNQIVLGNSSMTSAVLFGTGNGCLSASSGVITGSGSACGSGGGGSAFSALTGGTNTAATMLVGTGASLGFTGSGVLNANQIQGIAISGTPSAGQVPTATSSSAATWQTPTTGVSSVSNTDGTLSISPTTGAVIGGINLGHTYVWTGFHTFTVGVNLSGTSSPLQLNGSAGAAGQCPVSGGVGVTPSWGTCGGGGGGISGSGTTGFVPLWTGTTAIGNSHLDDGVTTAATITSTEPIAISGTVHGVIVPAGTAVSGLAANVVYASDATTGFAEVNENNTGLSRVCTAGNGICAGGTGTIVASAEVVSFSATPTFATSTNVSRIVLTNNITSFTLGTGSDGQDKKLCFKQGSGPYTVTPPANVHGFFTIGTVNAEWNCQSFVYDNTNSIWLADGPGVVNQ